MSVLLWDDTPVASNAEQERLLAPLLDVLRSRRWIDSRSTVRTELAWNGRHVDLATLTTSGVTSAYEMKLGSFHRVLEQAMYNRLSFDRSWAVVDGRPLDRNLDQARENGIGVILLRDRMVVLASPVRQSRSAPVRARLRKAFEKEVG